MSAEELKAQGNKAFSAGNYQEALNYYTKCIQLDSQNHVLFSNRSGCYAALHQYNDALMDADKCIRLKPDWVRGFSRRGAALHGMRRYREATEAYEAGLLLDPNNQGCIQGLEDVKMSTLSEARDPIAKVFTPEAFHKLQEHPKLSLLLMQPDFVKILDEVIRDPKAASKYFSNQQFMLAYLYLSGMGIPDLSMGDDDEPSSPKPAPTKPQETSQKVKELSEEEKEAVALKEEGNKLYLSKSFDAALEKYQAAAAKDPKNTLYLLNATAVYFEKEEYEKCIEECRNGVEHGRENKCDYTIIGKLMTREAFCLQKVKKYEEAISVYKRALLEWRNPDTLKKLDLCEKEYQKLLADAYIDPEIAKEKKEEGNELFKNGKYPEAVAAYTEAIKRLPTEHTAYSNRAAAYLKLCAYNDALKDAEKCLELKPDFVKAHARKGHSYFWTKQYHRALKAYDDGLKLDPQNMECRDGKMRTMIKIQEMATGQSGDNAEAARQAMNDPEIASIMQDSYMQMILEQMQNDPSRIKDYMKDPTLSAKLQKLVNAGIIRFA